MMSHVILIENRERELTRYKVRERVKQQMNSGKGEEETPRPNAICAAVAYITLLIICHSDCPHVTTTKRMAKNNHSEDVTSGGVLKYRLTGRNRV